MILFSQVNQDTAMDLVPLHEIIHVADMDEEAVAKGEEVHDDDELVCIKIDTSETGYNSGRPYELRGPADIMSNIVAKVPELAEGAKKRKNKESEFIRYQSMLARKFDSEIVQTLSAGLILAVLLRPPRARPFTLVD